jgi:hypothetical protein
VARAAANRRRTTRILHHRSRHARRAITPRAPALFELGAQPNQSHPGTPAGVRGRTCRPGRRGLKHTVFGSTSESDETPSTVRRSLRAQKKLSRSAMSCAILTGWEVTCGLPNRGRRSYEERIMLTAIRLEANRRSSFFARLLVSEDAECPWPSLLQVRARAWIIRAK